MRWPRPKRAKCRGNFRRRLVLGCDQILVTADGQLLDKAEIPTKRKAQLAMLSGTTHRLISAAVICENGEPVWRIVDTAQMTMRSLVGCVH